MPWAKLTGGVAHDFNNVLQVIGGNAGTERARCRWESEAQTRRLTSAHEAVERVAGLPPQLLAFARREPLEPKVFMRPSYARLRRHAARVLGEAVEMETMVSGGL